MHEEVFRAIIKTVTADDIMGIELFHTSDFFRSGLFDDWDFRRCIDLRTRTYVSRRSLSGRKASKELDTDVATIRQIIMDSGILDIELDDRLRFLDVGDDLSR